MWKISQLVSEPAKEGTLLDLLFANREGLVGDVVVGGPLGHGNHEMIEFLILREGGEGTVAEVLLPEGRLACSGAWLTEPLGRQS